MTSIANLLKDSYIEISPIELVEMVCKLVGATVEDANSGIVSVRSEFNLNKLEGLAQNLGFKYTILLQETSTTAGIVGYQMPLGHNSDHDMPSIFNDDEEYLYDEDNDIKNELAISGKSHYVKRHPINSLQK